MSWRLKEGVNPLTKMLHISRANIGGERFLIGAGKKKLTFLSKRRGDKVGGNSIFS